MKTASIWLRRDLLATGRTDTEIRGALRRGDLVRLAPGAFASGEHFRGLDPEARYRLRVRATAVQRDPGVLVSHVSAAALFELPLIGMSLDRVHLTRAGSGGSRLRGGTQVHASTVPELMRTVLAGTPATSAARTLVDLGRTEPLSGAVAAGDAALQRQLVSPSELSAALIAAAWHKGSPRARRALAQCDGRAESPGESLTRLALLQHGVTGIDLQVWILDERGRRVGRVDLACLDAGVLIEFDGKVKYTRLLRPGQSVTEAVLDEKRREERLTELGWLVIRVVWDDLSSPERLAERIQRACRSRVRLVRAGGLRGAAERTEPLVLARLDRR